MAVVFVCSVCNSHNEDNDIIVGSIGIYSINGSMVVNDFQENLHFVISGS